MPPSQRPRVLPSKEELQAQDQASKKRHPHPGVHPGSGRHRHRRGDAANPAAAAAAAKAPPPAKLFRQPFPPKKPSEPSGTQDQQVEGESRKPRPSRPPPNRPASRASRPPGHRRYQDHAPGWPGAFLHKSEHQNDTSACPLPGLVASYAPNKRTALASHPRSGSTWLRFMLERASSLPCGFEDPGWANILPHVGEDPSHPQNVNKEGLVVKTHSICYGCWADAGIEDRLTITGHTRMTLEKAAALVGQEYAERIQSKGCCLVFPPSTLESMIRQPLGSKSNGRVS
ncbi:unnamed protein product [Symbiodinium natans]|uniref:Uncharacterized protein n=1 Tax=Symbiodinium natans TaxID=878477 RepID=A0A812UT04_9DINO|nr:unnamed protein product [Symbiodinium natans]